MTPKKALTIAGSDCSGGAGIQADLKTFQERDVYGMSVLTVMVAMKPETWEHVVVPVNSEMIAEQFATIIPGIGADAAKTGMLIIGSSDNTITIANKKLNIRFVFLVAFICFTPS